LAGTLELTVDVILFLFGAYEILPHVTPEPALVYSVDRDAIPGDVREVTTFRNPTNNWALHNMKANWTVDQDNVELVAGPDSPRNSISPKVSREMQFGLNEPLASEHRFRTYLRSKSSFLVINHSFSAEVLRVTSFGSYFQPVEPLTEDSWSGRIVKSYILLTVGIAVFACFIFLFHKMLAKISGRQA
jgi:hypothetical protein